MGLIRRFHIFSGNLILGRCASDHCKVMLTEVETVVRITCSNFERLKFLTQLFVVGGSVDTYRNQDFIKLI